MSDVEVTHITVTRRISDDDHTVTITCSPDLSFMDGVGMLAQAMHTWGETNGLEDVEGGAVTDPG